MFEIKLKELREQYKLTQKNLASKLNLTQSTIAYYEIGKKLPTIENLISIAKFFNVSTDYLLGLSLDNYIPAKSINVVKKEENVYINNSFTNEQNKLLNYYNRLNSEDKEYVIGIMIGLYKEDKVTNRQVNILRSNIDKDIALELESYRQELLIKKKDINNKNTVSPNIPVLYSDDPEILKELESYRKELINEKKNINSSSTKRKA